MNPTDVSQLVANLRANRGALAARWRAHLTDRYAAAVSADVIGARLQALTDRVLSLLETPTLDISETRAIGTELARCFPNQAEVLGQTQLFLSRDLLESAAAAEGADARAALQNRLTSVLGEIATGFVQQYETALRTSEERYRRLLETSHEGVWVIDAHSITTFVNQRMADMLGYTIGEMLGRSLFDFVDAAGETFLKQKAERRRQGLDEQYEFKFQRKDGTALWTIISTNPLYDEHQQYAGSLGMLTDITERKRVEQSLRESEELHRITLSNISDAVFMTDDAGLFSTYICSNISVIFGYSAEEIRALGTVEALLGSEALFDKQELIARGEISNLEREIVDKYGERHVLLINVKRVAIGGATILYTCRDITERKRAEAALQESEERFRITFERAAVGISHTAIDGRFLRVNQRLCEIVGYTRAELLTMRFQDVTHPDDLDRDLHYSHKVLSGETETHTLEKRYIHKRGHTIWVNVTLSLLRKPSGQPKYFIAIVEDITEKRQIEAQLRRQERLAAVGQLAAGIAHDFNNILATISLYTGLLKNWNLPDKPRAYLDTLAKQTDRAADLIQQILDFSRQSPLQRQAVDVLRILHETINLLKRTLPANIELVLETTVEAARIHADPTRIQQVFMNLAVNARDAMPAGGRLKFTVAETAVLPPQFSIAADPTPSAWVQIAIADTGVGIPDDVAARLFEPFFTTKEPGRGVGLGLAQVYGIIKQHDGFIDVASQVGRGTTFTLYLPAARANSAVHKTHEGLHLALGQGETLLIVEDDPAAREAMVYSAESLNYRPLAVATGREALEALALSENEIDLIVCDMMMPEMSGYEFLLALREKNVHIPVIIVSGYLLEDELEKLQAAGMYAWLSKPLRYNQLSQLIRAALDERQDGD